MFTKGNLPKSNWKKYMKKSVTLMVRMDEPFEVETQHGIVRCENGFLAVDDEGYPYPISAEIHARTYLELGEI